jgi:shikimate dehydrogenase
VRVISGATAVYGLLGRPVRHSRSPALHGAWLERYGVDGIYACFEVPPGREAGAADAIRTLGLAGANLTVPLKEVVAPHLDALDGTAALLGAVNTVVVRDGRLIGHNTDAAGFVDGLRAAFGDVVPGARAVVLGAGGAGLAVAAGLAGAGAASLSFLNRTVDRAEAAAARVGAAYPGVVVDAAPLEAGAFRAAVAGADVVVQATSGPGAAIVGGFDPAAVPPSAVWCDLNYWMAEPPLLAVLAARGHRVQGGLPMLVHQAARAFALFTGISPDTTALPPGFG